MRRALSPVPLLALIVLLSACDATSPTGPKPFGPLPADIAVSPPVRAETVAILDALGAATPGSQFSLFGSSSSAVVFSEQFPGPEFVLNEPMDITEIGAFLNNCGSIVSGVPECPGTRPFTVQIRPSLNGMPDPSVILASFILSHDDSPLVISYESVAINQTLGEGRYFALFAPQGGDVGFLLANATNPFSYEAATVNLGFFFPPTGTSGISPDNRVAVRILGTPTKGGAIVSNSGRGEPDVLCAFGQFTATQGTVVHSASGNAVLSCRFSGLERIGAPEVVKGWLCTISQDGQSETRQSQWVRSPSGTGHLTCHFNGRP